MGRKVPFGGPEGYAISACETFRTVSLGSSVNSASSRSYAVGYDPAEPGPIGLGLGGFPGTPLLETVWKSGLGTESGFRAPPNGDEGASTDRCVTPRMCTMVLPGYFPDRF
jgi:hypothetical protein